jgi:hypothetical protein
MALSRTIHGRGEMQGCGTDDPPLEKMQSIQSMRVKGGLRKKSGTQWRRAFREESRLGMS